MNKNHDFPSLVAKLKVNFVCGLEKAIAASPQKQISVQHPNDV
jgi:hypothetical protein